MILVKPSFKTLKGTIEAAELIELAGRICYKSEAAPDSEKTRSFVKMLLDRDHQSVLEHAVATVEFVIDRGVSHELVRHRLASYSQESTRYCNYRGGVTFILPPWVGVESGEYLDETYIRNQLTYADLQWFAAMLNAEARYKQLLVEGWTPQQARAVLPNSTKTEIVMTANFREWRHVFKLRTAAAAHPQMREVMIPLCKEFVGIWPEVFGGILDE